MTGTRGPLFDPLLGASAVDVSDEAWIGALVEVEAALARAGVRVGLVGEATARALDAVAAELSGVPGLGGASATDPSAPGLDLSAFAPAALGRASVSGGNPVIPLVTALRDAATAADPAAVRAEIHRGATSQDVMDTALALLVHRAAGVLEEQADLVVVACADLARTHRDTPVVARTLGQQALPTTFGLVAAGWGRSVRTAAAAAVDAARAVPVQFGGAAGTLAAVHPRGLTLADALADELKLPRAVAPWHTDRTPLTLLAGALGAVAGAVAKSAGDVIRHAATEVGEVTLAESGGSSAMPHKRNPTAAVESRAAALRVPGLVSTMLAAADHEHQRAAGAWHAEWETLTDLLRLTVGAVSRLAAALGCLQADADAMARNLDLTGGALLAERVTVALAAALPDSGPDAREVVTRACAAGRRLDHDEEIVAALGRDQVAALLDPAGYTGHAGDLVDRLLPTLTPLAAEASSAPPETAAPETAAPDPQEDHR